MQIISRGEVLTFQFSCLLQALTCNANYLQRNGRNISCKLFSEGRFYHFMQNISRGFNFSCKLFLDERINHFMHIVSRDKVLTFHVNCLQRL